MTDESLPILLQITIHEQGVVEIWSSEARPVSDVVAMLRAIADDFEQGIAQRKS